MNILFLQGPNLNLIGVKSSDIKERLTLDKLNKRIREESKKAGISLKILQTHKEFKAINFLQRNRNWAEGLILISTSWAYNNFTLLETIKLIKLKTVSIYFENNYSFGAPINRSIIKGDHIQSLAGPPIQVCSEALKLIKL
jgi:3-dehydroquinate dehydratase-2